MVRAAALALILFALLTGDAHAADQLPVYVVEGQLMEFAGDAGGAVGLLVPGAGPEPTREAALAPPLPRAARGGRSPACPWWGGEFAPGRNVRSPAPDQR